MTRSTLQMIASASLVVHLGCSRDSGSRGGGSATIDDATGSGDATIDGSDPPMPPTIAITDYGATPDDATDDTEAIVNTNNAATAQGKGIYIPPGTYRIKGMTLTTSVYGAGMDVSILYAYDAEDPSIWIKGNNITLEGFQKKSSETTRNGAHWGFRLDVVDGFTIENVFINGGSGLFMYNASNGKIVSNKLVNTVADSIHNTHNTSNVVIANNYVRGAGDDSIAVVNYGSDFGRNFLIQDNDIGDQTYARGITVAGAADVTVQRNKIVHGASAAGINFESGGYYQTGPGINVIVRDNIITDYPLIAGTGHPAILVWAGSGGALHERILIENNTVTRGVNDVGVRLDGSTNVAVVNNAFEDITTVVARPRDMNTYCAGNFLDGAAVDPACGGSSTFTVTGSTLTY